jgi:Tfp pilus assembly major pilin PilA
MKRTFSLLAFLALMAGVLNHSYAADKKQEPSPQAKAASSQADSLYAELAGNAAEMKAAQEEKPQEDQEDKNILKDDAALKKYEVDRAAYRQELDAWDARHARYVAAGCQVPKLPHEQFVTCQSKYNEDQPYYNHVEANNQALNAEARTVQTREQLNQRTLDNFAKRKATNYKIDFTLPQKRDGLLKRLGELKSTVDVCARSLGSNATAEEVKLKCGNVQFDGARSSLNKIPPDLQAILDRMGLH